MNPGTRSTVRDAATIPTVRRLVFILLLAILPIQFSWAAVTSYCRHETGSATKHFGHHQHQHRAVTGDVSKNPEAGSLTGTDNDCEICHLSAAQTILDVTGSVVGPQSESPRFEYGWRYESYIATGPERPDRDHPTPAVRLGGAVVIGACLLA